PRRRRRIRRDRNRVRRRLSVPGLRMPLPGLRRPPARSLYFRLLQLGLVLVLLPSLLVAIAWIYERYASRAQMDHLARVPRMLDGLGSVAPDTVAGRERVVVAWLDAKGAVARRTA